MEEKKELMKKVAKEENIDHKNAECVAYQIGFLVSLFICIVFDIIEGLIFHSENLVLQIVIYASMFAVSLTYLIWVKNSKLAWAATIIFGICAVMEIVSYIVTKF